MYLSFTTSTCAITSWRYDREGDTTFFHYEISVCLIFPFLYYDFLIIFTHGKNQRAFWIASSIYIETVGELSGIKGNSKNEHGFGIISFHV